MPRAYPPTVSKPALKARPKVRRAGEHVHPLLAEQSIALLRGLVVGIGLLGATDDGALWDLFYFPGDGFRSASVCRAAPKIQPSGLRLPRHLLHGVEQRTKCRARYRALQVPTFPLVVGD